MSLTRYAAPAVEPVSAAEVWAHLRVPLTGSPAAPVDATLIALLTTAAVDQIDGRDGWLGRALVTQTWDLTLDGFPASADFIALPLPPLQSVVSVKYIDTAGVQQTMSSSLYALSADRHYQPRLDLAYGATWPATRCQRDAVTIRFVAGFASGNSPEDATAVPKSIKAALLLTIGHLYEHREEVVMGMTAAPLPLGAEHLLTPYRVRRF